MDVLREHERAKRRTERPVPGGAGRKPATGVEHRLTRFVHYGPLTITEFPSGLYAPLEDEQLVGVRGDLGIAGSSSSVVQLRLNGSPIGSIVWAAGEQLKVVTFDQLLRGDQDVLTAACTVAAEDAMTSTLRLDLVPA